MANLKDLIVNGASRFLGKIYANKGAHISGDSVTWDQSALPEFSGAPTYLLGIESFANGGTTKWKSTSSISVGSLSTSRTIDGVNFNGSANIIHYGSCSTAAATAAKTVACTSFVLDTGAWIAVKFTVTNTAANPTLNVNSTGAKAIYYRGSAISAGYLAANRTYLFVYNGTQFDLIGDIDTNSNTTYSAGTGLTLSGTTFNHSNSVTAATAGTSSATSGSTLAVPYVTYDAQGHVTGSGTHTHTVTGFLTSHQTIKQDGITGATVNRFGTCGTAAGTAAKTVDITTGTFNLETGAKVTVKFTNANTANTPTLNVNSKGAKNIFHKGAQITSGGNKALLAGTVDFVYDGTQWQLIGNYIDTDNNTDTKVTQTNTTASANYRLLLSETADDTTRTETSRKSTNFYANPSTGELRATKYNVAGSGMISYNTTTGCLEITT